MSLPKWLCWLDIETNGRPAGQGGLILEIAAVVTPAELNENGVFQPMAEFQSLVWNGDLSEIQAGTPDNVYIMHNKSRLWDDFRTSYSYPPVEVQYKLLEVLRPFEGTMCIIGSGVGHFDVPFLKVVMPDIVNRMEYYSIDIGSFGRVLEMAIPSHEVEEVKNAHKGNHRAMWDVEAFIQQTESFIARTNHWYYES